MMRTMGEPMHVCATCHEQKPESAYRFTAVGTRFRTCKACIVQAQMAGKRKNVPVTKRVEAVALVETPQATEAPPMNGAVEHLDAQTSDTLQEESEEQGGVDTPSTDVTGEVTVREWLSRSDSMSALICGEDLLIRSDDRIALLRRSGVEGHIYFASDVAIALIGERRGVIYY